MLVIAGVCSVTMTDGNLSCEDIPAQILNFMFLWMLDSQKKGADIFGIFGNLGISARIQNKVQQLSIALPSQNNPVDIIRTIFFYFFLQTLESSCRVREDSHWTGKQNFMCKISGLAL